MGDRMPRELLSALAICLDSDERDRAALRDRIETLEDELRVLRPAHSDLVVAQENTLRELSDLRQTHESAIIATTDMAAAHAALSASVTHPDHGRVEVRSCSNCGQPFPEWQNAPAMPCAVCRAAAVEPSAEAPTVRHDAPEEVRIAATAHEAIRSLEAAVGDRVSPPWPSAPGWLAESRIAAVRAVLAGQETTAKAAHDGWRERLEASGWRYGPRFNAAGMQHPSLVPFEQLSEDERTKHRLVIAVTQALTSHQG